MSIEEAVKAGMKSVKTPKEFDKGYTDECMLCFTNPFDKDDVFRLPPGTAPGSSRRAARSRATACSKYTKSPARVNPFDEGHPENLKFRILSEL
ncbi:hypothetical protein DIPPA_34540 [Diplonema papillatum]|nr:hypothetical protein DIPPA_34540 [Diplonema papillatum]